jgi:hypothetical protein
VAPTIVSPLGAILKDGGNGVRLIHDGSRPIGEAMNNYAIHHSVHYQSVDEAYTLAKPDTFLCKIDLRWAYRSVPISPKDYCLTGVKWTFEGDSSPTYLFDVRIPFGSSRGPNIFHRLSQAVRRMMARRGYANMVVYLDDFLCVQSSYAKCCEAQQVLISLLIRLGFQISWGKVLGPARRVEFLGVTIDTSDCTVSLSDNKVDKLHDKLQKFYSKKRASKRQLQSLAGSLNWACQAVRGGRFFLRRILDTINLLKQSSHKCKLSMDFKKDVTWWLTFLQQFNGTLYYRETRSATVSTDACNEGAGMFYLGQWQYVNWKVDANQSSSLHINHKEVLAVTLAVKRWAGVWCNTDVTVITDSTVAKAVINKGTCKNRYVMAHLRDMFWLLVKYNIRLRAVHIPGSLNQISDAVSRLHESGQVLRLFSLLNLWHHGKYTDSFHATCCSNMSSRAFQVIKPQLRKWYYRLN